MLTTRVPIKRTRKMKWWLSESLPRAQWRRRCTIIRPHIWPAYANDRTLQQSSACTQHVLTDSRSYPQYVRFCMGPLWVQISRDPRVGAELNKKKEETAWTLQEPWMITDLVLNICGVKCQSSLGSQQEPMLILILIATDLGHLRHVVVWSMC